MYLRSIRLGMIFGASLLAAGCSTSDSIDPGGETFDEVDASATVNLVGNEPFWGMEIAPVEGDEAAGFSATYSTPENIDGATFAAARFAGNNGLGFSGELDGAAVQIALTPGDCNDTMSDRTYPYTATATIGEQTLYGCGYTSEEPFVEDELADQDLAEDAAADAEE